jgi:hypothetical protein
MDHLKNSIKMSRYSENEVKESEILLENTISTNNITLEDLAWGCKAALLEMNNDDPVLCEQVKLKSNNEVFEYVFEARTLRSVAIRKAAEKILKGEDPGESRFLKDGGLEEAEKLAEKMKKMQQQIDNPSDEVKALTKKLLSPAQKRAARRKLQGKPTGIDPLKDLNVKSDQSLDDYYDITLSDKEVDKMAKDYSKQQSNIDKLQKPKGMSTTAKLLTVVAVTALAYGVYKYIKARKSKAQAAEAAAQKSNQLASQAKKQGKDKVAAKAQQNAKNWQQRAKKYKAKGE